MIWHDLAPLRGQFDPGTFHDRPELTVPDHNDPNIDHRNDELALIVAHSQQAAEPAARALVACAFRLAPHIPMSEMSARLKLQLRAHHLIIKLDDEPADLIHDVIGQAEDFAAETHAALIIDFPAALIDDVASASHSPETVLLCDADQIERVSAIATSRPAHRLTLNDSAVDIDSLRLKRLADEVQRIARALNGLTAGSDKGIDYRTPPTPSAMRDAAPLFAAQPADLTVPDLPDASEVRTVIRLRRLRDTMFEAELFADPAWDMLLDLFAARIEGDQVAVSSLCIAAAVPPTTALRWIKTMTDAGLFERHADPMDGRRVFIRLTNRAMDGMARYFAAARRIGGFLV
jgi:hypothetical protein